MESLRLHIIVEREDGGRWQPTKWTVEELARFGLLLYNYTVDTSEKEPHDLERAASQTYAPTMD